ncbi:MAG: hypothetical protein AAB502_05480 [Chloroflexota bacterium]
MRLREFSKTVWRYTKPSPKQIEVAKCLGVRLRPDDSFLIAAERISDAVGEAVGQTPRLEPTAKQYKMAEDLKITIDGDSRRVAWAKIRQAFQVRNLETVKRMRLKPGAVVRQLRTFTHYDGKISHHEFFGIVSAIRPDGHVYFKEGESAWPSELTKINKAKKRGLMFGWHEIAETEEEHSIPPK